MDDEQRVDDAGQGKPPRRRPWWVSGTTLKNSRNMAVWYSAIFVAYGVLVIVTRVREPWTAALCFLWGTLAVWAWLSVRYFAHNDEKTDPADRR